MRNDKQISQNNHVLFNEITEAGAEGTMGTPKELAEESPGGNETGLSQTDPKSGTPHTAEHQPRKRMRLRTIRKLLSKEKSDTILDQLSDSSSKRQETDEQETQAIVTREGEDKWNFKSHGLDITTMPSSPSVNMLFGIPADTTTGVMHFLPRRRNEFSHDTMSENLLYGIKGLKDFFTAVDDGNIPPAYLIGTTNKNMANMATKLGFTIITNDMLKPKPFSDVWFEKLFKIQSRGKYRVVAETSAVRAKLDELLTPRPGQTRSSYDLLEQRVRGSQQKELLQTAVKEE